MSRPTPIPRPDLAQLVARARPIRGLAVIGAILMLALAATACGASASEHTSLPVDTEVAPSSTSPDPTSPTTDPSDTTAADVVARYQEFWQVWLRANNPPNPDYPDLLRYYTGRQLEGARTAIMQKQQSGQVVVLPPGSLYAHHASATIYGNGVSASVIDCAVDDSEVLVESTRQVVNNDLTAQLMNAEMVLIDGEWRVSGVEIVKEWRGATTCAAG